MPKKSFDWFFILSGVRNVTITSLTSALESTKKVELIKLSYFNFLYHSSLKIYRELYLDLTSRSLLKNSKVPTENKLFDTSQDPGTSF